ncbi:MAG: ATPase domain-containing protein [Candidatus Micrarchaeia archaeon]
MPFVPFQHLKTILPDGIPAGNQVLISGPPGSGKTILAMQFLLDGIKNGENGVYFILESNKEALVEQMASMGIEIGKLIKDGKLDIITLDPTDIYVLLDDMEQHVRRMDAKRIALDSISILSVYSATYRNLPEDLIAFLEKTKYTPPISTSSSVKSQMIYTAMSRMRRLNCTAALISELPRSSKWFSRDTVSEFFCDGIILLEYHVLGPAGVTRTLSVVKMRGTGFAEGVHEFKLGKGGVKLVKA